MPAYVSELYRYPVKSAGGERVNALRIDNDGLLEYDRRWAAVDANGVCLTQRSHPRLVQINARVADEQLYLFAPGMPRFVLPVDTYVDQAKQPLIQATVTKEAVRVCEASHEASVWFSEALGETCRLVKSLVTARKACIPNAHATAYVAFPDVYPFLIISQASLDDLNSRLAVPIPQDRIRPNVIVCDTEPYAEDNWDKIEIGSIPLVGGPLCARCVITTTDQLTGIRGKEPLATLAKYRRTPGGVVFGRYFLHTSMGMMRVGDDIRYVHVTNPRI